MNATQTKFDSDLAEYRRLGGKVDSLRIIEDESAPKYAVDFQYLMMNRWAFDLAWKMAGEVLHDFASKVDFSAFMASRLHVKHYDIREPDFSVPGLEYVKADITALPLPNNSVGLASCLHVAEHIGLGRYGDRVDPDGFNKACSEISRVIEPGGNLLFAVPVGIPSVAFNAHRVLSTDQVIKAFPAMRLVEHSGIASNGKMVRNCPIGSLDFDRYGCGLFHFVKDSK